MFVRTFAFKLQDLLFDGDMPLKDIAEAVGKPYTTLMRELNPFDKASKLGAETLFAIVRVTRDPRIVSLIAEEMGIESLER